MSVVPRASAQAPGIDIGTPAPTWVEPVEVPSARSAEGGLEILLHDQQWQLEDRASVRFQRIAYRVQSTAGLSEGAEIAIDVSSREQLAWHYVRRVRDGESVELLSTERVRVIQPEAALEAGLYDESRSALLFLDDIRVGDTIEYAYSLRMDTRLLGGRHAARAIVGAPGARHVHFAATWPANRSVRARIHELPNGYAVVERETELRIDARDVVEPEIPGDAPRWLLGRPWVELSEFQSWAEVARWALEHYRVEDPTTALAEVPMERFRAAGDRAAQAEAALRFVQDEVRYLGLEVADRALVPHPPAEVARRRYGDCKDKSLLLVTILRALGVDVAPALTHSFRGAALDGELPSPYAFDHVVVRADLGGEPVWLDATRTFERGPLSARPPLSIRRALPIDADATALLEVPLPVASSPTLSIDERYGIQAARARLQVVTVYRGAQVNSFRRDVDQSGTDSIGRSALAFYRRLGLDARMRAPLRIADDAHGGALTMHEDYELFDFMGPGERALDAWSASEYLRVPEASRPPGPLALPFPLHIVHRVSVDSDRGWDIEETEDRIESPSFVASRTVRVHGNRLELEVRLQTLTDQVDADAVAEHARRADAAQELFGYSIVDYAPPEPQAGVRAALCPALIVLGLLLSLGVGALRRRIPTRRRRAFDRSQRFARGASPQEAIEALDLDAAERAHRSASCCGDRIDGGVWSQAQLGGARIFVHTAACPRCGESKRTYYRQTASTSPD